MRTAIYGLAALVLGIGLAGCGASGVIDPVAQAADTTAGESMHMTMTATTNADGLSITMSGAGDFDNGAKAGAMTVTTTLPTVGKVTFDEVLDGHTIYMTSPLFASELPDGKKWMKLDLDKAMKSAGLDLNQLSSANPTSALSSLKAAGNVETVGTETVDGITLTHYRATLDPTKIPGYEKLEKLAHPTYDPADVWIDADGHVRHTKVSYSAELQGTRAEMVMDMRFSDFGKPVDVAVPTAAESVDKTDEASAGLQSGG
jgi:hypothetical protein